MKKLMLKNMLLLFPPATLSEEWLRDLYLIFYNPLFTTCLVVPYYKACWQYTIFLMTMPWDKIMRKTIQVVIV